MNGLKLERRCHPRLIPASFNNSGIHRELDEACKHKCERDAVALVVEEGDGNGKGGKGSGDRVTGYTCLVKQNISLSPMYGC